MFPCPVCRQVANLDASVSMESLVDPSGQEILQEEYKEMDIDDFNDTIKSGGLERILGEAKVSNNIFE